MIRINAWRVFALAACLIISSSPALACSMQYAADGSVSEQTDCDSEEQYDTEQASQFDEPSFQYEVTEGDDESGADDCYRKADIWLEKSHEQDPSGYYDYGEFLDKCLGESPQ